MMGNERVISVSAGVNTGAQNGNIMVREWSAYMGKESSLISEIVTHFCVICDSHYARTKIVQS